MRMIMELRQSKGVRTTTLWPCARRLANELGELAEEPGNGEELRPVSLACSVPEAHRLSFSIRRR